MRLTLGFSPCPNDTFIFDALVHNKIDTEGLEFDVYLQDVERLNKWSFKGKLDITKLSYHAFIHSSSEYLILDSGSALGNNCGPILIKKKGTILNVDSKIAIPGKFTTANMLLDIAFPLYKNKVETLFSKIEESVINGTVQAGLIIHENRFTYLGKGLEKIKDLGEFWHESTDLPIPLGGIVVKKTVPKTVQQKIERVLKRSIEYAIDKKDYSLPFITSNSQSIKKEIVKAHINLYVNKYSVSLGLEGRNAIKLLFEKSNNLNECIFKDLFVK